MADSPMAKQAGRQDVAGDPGDGRSDRGQQRVLLRTTKACGWPKIRRFAHAFR